jgi:hypothetical protein
MCWMTADSAFFRACLSLAYHESRNEMIAKTERALHDGVSGIGISGRRKDAGPSDEEVGEPVNPAVTIDDAMSRIVGHPGRAHVVTAGDLILNDRRIGDGVGK